MNGGGLTIEFELPNAIDLPQPLCTERRNSLNARFGGTRQVRLHSSTAERSTTKLAMNQITPLRSVRRRWQFGVRALFVATTLVALVCAWYLHESRKIAAKQAAINAVRASQGSIYLGARNWAQYALRDPLPHDIAQVYLNYSELEQPLAALAQVKQRTPLKIHLNLYQSLTPELWQQLHDCPHSLLLGMDTPHDVGKLIGCRSLHSLNLDGRNVTDKDLAVVGKLTQLRRLELTGGEVTDFGLSHLQELHQLHELGLGGCRHVTRDGLVHLEQLPNLEVLEIGSSTVSTAWIGPLRRFSKLRRLVLHADWLSAEDIAQFRSQSQFAIEISDPALSR